MLDSKDMLHCRHQAEGTPEDGPGRNTGCAGLKPHEDPDNSGFRQTLAENKIRLTRKQTATLQINVGLLCNMACRHCHLDAGPDRREIMTKDTMDHVVALATRHPFETIDITGGAPEMNPHIAAFIQRLAPLTSTLILRSNLTAISEKGRSHLIDLCCRHRVILVASFPSVNEDQAEAQRGQGTFAKALNTLRELNRRGYGKEGTGLILNLVSNPVGAFLPTPQEQQEKRFRDVLLRKFNIEFNNLYTFANAPLGRFRTWLDKSDNLAGYLQKLAESFNPCAVEGLMCRSLMSVSWNGYLFDCDFNQAVDLGMGGRKTHIRDLNEPPRKGSEIAQADHCYTCTAGAGFT